MGVIAIDYQTLTLVVVLMFALVGFMRGWIKEGITTLIMLGLVGLLYYPSLMTPIVERLNQILKIVKIIIKDGGSFNLSAMAKSAGSVTDVIPKDNPYTLFLWLLVILLALSYVGGQFALGDKKLSALSRILGGVAGALNGFIAISLFKEYMLRYLEKLPLPSPATAGAAAAVQTAAPKAGVVAVSLQNLPEQPFIGSVGPTILILGGVALVVLLANQFIHAKGGKK